MGFYQKGKYGNSIQAKSRYRKKVKKLKKKFPNMSNLEISCFIRSDFEKSDSQMSKVIKNILKK